MRQHAATDWAAVEESINRTREHWEDGLKWILLNILNLDKGEVLPPYRVPYSAESRTRITHLVMLVKRTVEGLRLLPPSYGELPANFIGAQPPIYRYAKELQEINETFRQVRLYPHAMASFDGRSIDVRQDVFTENVGGEKPFFDAEYVPGPNGEMILNAPQMEISTGTSLNVNEIQAILALTNLLRKNEIDSLRRCDCGKWFMAVRSDQHSCSATCRQRKHASSQRVKDKRKQNRARAAKKRTAKKTAGR